MGHRAREEKEETINDLDDFDRAGGDNNDILCVSFYGISVRRLKEFLELHTSLTSEAVPGSPRSGHRKYTPRCNDVLNILYADSINT
jgi:hypothetical protein